MEGSFVYFGLIISAFVVDESRFALSEFGALSSDFGDRGSGSILGEEIVLAGVNIVTE